MKKLLLLAMAALTLGTACAASINLDDADAALERKDYATALPLYRRAADQGDSYGQLQVAGFYFHGYGVAQDYRQAVNWYKLSAEQGEPLAQFALGIQYSKGGGVAQDHAESVKWYRLAAAQGFERAQHNLSMKYLRGEGVGQDPIRAYMWADLASATGSKESTVLRDYVAGQMQPIQIAEAQTMAQECRAKKLMGCTELP